MRAAGRRMASDIRAPGTSVGTLCGCACTPVAQVRRVITFGSIYRRPNARQFGRASLCPLRRPVLFRRFARPVTPASPGAAPRAQSPRPPRGCARGGGHLAAMIGARTTRGWRPIFLRMIPERRRRPPARGWGCVRVGGRLAAMIGARTTRGWRPIFLRMIPERRRAATSPG